ncbi:hypothetical protein CUMW_240770 [Citrus unshiu]|uniref:Uncharacterized protein n=1 Tax=Citrus unshiu TaxID=55188 RepID=A0A2H5QL92_CITUN|nr:hypothetical protein CUMW_240770 [Citrus unshiu]
MPTTTISDEHDLIPAAAGADSTGKIAIQASENCHILSHTMASATKACKRTQAPKPSKAISKTQQSKPHNSPTNHPKGTYKKKKDKK